ncbi:MAG: response regulator transcription factor [Proteobacteria bacterium]|nr:response regulator transcription factor [Pseudomonadota bacterium]
MRRRWDKSLFIKTSDRQIGLIVYHAHETDIAKLADVTALREAFYSAKIVIISDATRLTAAVVKDLLALGASGFILSSHTSLKMMISALSLVASGGTFVPKELLFADTDDAQLLEMDGPPGARRLSRRKLDVLKLVKQGKPNKLIAFELGMSLSTVKVHIRHVMRKMGSTNRTHVAMNADRHLTTRTAGKQRF